MRRTVGRGARPALVFADGDRIDLPRRHERRRADRPGAHPQRRGLLLAEPRLRPLRRQGDDGRRAAGSTAPSSSTSGASGSPTSTAPARPTSSTSAATACGSTSTSPATAGATPTRLAVLPPRRRPGRGAGARPARQRHGLPGLVVAAAGRRRPPLRYVDLMGGQKPHLLVTTRNNLGAETEVEYAPSTKFYLRTSAGTPWITRLPFPVHVVERVTVDDRWRGNQLLQHATATTTATSTASSASSAASAASSRSTSRTTAPSPRQRRSPYITDDQRSTSRRSRPSPGSTPARPDRERVVHQLEHEYFPHWFEVLHPGQYRARDFPRARASRAGPRRARASTRRVARGAAGLQGHAAAPGGLRARRRRAGGEAEQTPVKLFSAPPQLPHPACKRRAATACGLPVTESEAITYHYELDLRPRRSRRTRASPTRSTCDRRVRQRPAVGDRGLSALAGLDDRPARCRTAPRR